MNTIMLSSREFNQDTGRAKKAANNGPVYITDRGRPTHVLLTIEKFEQLSGQKRNIVDILAMPCTTDMEAELEFEPHRLEHLIKPVEFD